MIRIIEPDDIPEESLEVNCIVCGEEMVEGHVCAALPPLSIDIAEDINTHDRFGG